MPGGCATGFLIQHDELIMKNFGVLAGDSSSSLQYLAVGHIDLDKKGYMDIQKKAGWTNIILRSSSEKPRRRDQDSPVQPAVLPCHCIYPMPFSKGQLSER